MNQKPVPTLFEWAGGMPAFERLTEVFYARVKEDSVLGPVFAQMAPDHPKRVAHFIAEVLGGPTQYTAERGGHPTMISHHANRVLTEFQRARWVRMLCESADEVGFPSDPEFRSAFVAYLEWGSRIAVLNSQPGAKLSADQPMPKWGWGEVKGPFQG